MESLNKNNVLIKRQNHDRKVNCFKRRVEKEKQAGAELGQAQLKLGLGFTSTNLH